MSPIVYNYTKTQSSCDSTTQQITSKFFVSRLSQKNAKMKKLIKKELSSLTSTININNRAYSFEAKKSGNDEEVLIHTVALQWSSNMTYILYATFTEQPIICKIILYLRRMVEDKRCTDLFGSRTMSCYHDPLSESPVQNVNWTLLDDFLDTEIYSPSNWVDKGGFYIDVRSIKTATTSVSF
jgi:hypothetical protein